MKITNKQFILILMVLALISGFFWAFVFGNDPGVSDDARGYDETAQSIVSEGIFNNDRMEDTLDRPVYSFFLAIIYKVFGHSFVIVRIIQILFFVMIALLVYKLCNLLFTEKVSRFAGVLTAFSYSLAAHAGILYREVLFAFLVLFLVWCLYKAQFTFKVIWFLLAGAVLGIMFLTNSVVQFLIFLILINFIFVFYKKRKIKDLIPRLVLFVLAFLLVLTPWFVFYKSNFGQIPTGGGGLYLAERAETMQNIDDKYLSHLIGNGIGDFVAFQLFSDYDPKLSRHGWEAWRKHDELLAQGQNVKEADKEFIEDSLRTFAKHPIMFLKMEFIDFLKFNQPMTPKVWMQAMFVGTHPGIADWMKILIIFGIRFVYLIFSGLIIYSILKTFKKWSNVSWLIIIIFYFNFVYSTLHATARYSIPIYPLYIIFLTLGVMLLINKFRHKDENLLNN